MSEEWRAVPGFDGYEVSDLGRVRSWRACPGRSASLPRLLRPTIKAHKGGYAQYGLMRDGKVCFFWGHRLVLEAFTGPRPLGLETRHLDGDPLNNALSNLRYGTRAENAADKKRHRADRVRLADTG